MKVGIETITWGVQMRKLGNALDLIAACGYQGVEFAQRLEKNTLGVVSLNDLYSELAMRNLQLISIVGGTLEEKIVYCKRSDPRHWPTYLYAEAWELESNPKALAEAKEYGMRLACHPRIFSPVSKLSHILQLCDTYQNLYFILDTAHCYLAGDDPIEVYRNIKDRLVSVHLKDWHAGYGRSFHRFARGFIELGLGELGTKLNPEVPPKEWKGR